MSQVIEAMLRWATTRPSAPAIVGDRQALTWSDLRQAVFRTVTWLQTSAPPQGPIALAIDNGPAWVVADLALMHLGRTNVPLPGFFTKDQADAVIQAAGVCAVLRPGSAFDIAGQPVDLQATGAALRPLHDQTAKITFTSGSTGQPKGVCLSLAQMEAVAASLVEILGEEYAGTHLAVLPLSILLENVAGLYSIILAGGAYRVADAATVGLTRPFRPDFAALLQAVVKSRASSLILTPELLRGLIGAKLASGLSLPHLQLVAVGGAKVAPALLHAAHLAGIPAVEGYGLSECGSVVALNRPGRDRPGAVGQPLPHLRVEIADDGEIVVGPSPFLGYVGGPSHSGPVRTGDLGRLDDEGFVHLSGRKSNLIITAFGRNVSPEWVESELLSQPEIGQAMVFGEAQAHLGALVVASRSDLRQANMQASIDAANARLPEYARIGRWRMVTPFDPAKGQLTANGSPRRATLSQAYAEFVAAPQETQ